MNFAKLSKKAVVGFSGISSSLLLFLIAAYRTIGVAHMGGSCRFQPSCSEYAVLVVKNESPLRAISLISKRLAKCRPGGPWGYDPVPERKEG